MTGLLRRATWARRLVALLAALGAARLFPGWWCERGAGAWFEGDVATQRGLADALVTFEADDDNRRIRVAPNDRFTGEWALVTHQMIALGLAQLCLARPEDRVRYAAAATSAALKSLRPEMRDFGTSAWHGEDAMASLAGEHGHAYLGYTALALGMARLVDPGFPLEAAAKHDALINAYVRRLRASPTGLIETYPGEAFPTDVAAVAAAVAVHGRATGADHAAVLRHWVGQVHAVQIDRASGLVHQRMGAHDGALYDAPRGSGTGLATYFAGFVDRGLAERLADGLFRHEATFWGFDAIREYPAGRDGVGDVDSGPVLFGVSVAATGFALAPARALGRRDSFERIYRTTSLFGMPRLIGAPSWFDTGGPIGNAMLFAFLTSGPELAP